MEPSEGSVLVLGGPSTLDRPDDLFSNMNHCAEITLLLVEQILISHTTVVNLAMGLSLPTFFGAVGHSSIPRSLVQSRHTSAWHKVLAVLHPISDSHLMPVNIEVPRPQISLSDTQAM